MLGSRQHGQQPGFLPEQHDPDHSRTCYRQYTPRKTYWRAAFFPDFLSHGLAAKRAFQSLVAAALWLEESCSLDQRRWLTSKCRDLLWFARADWGQIETALGHRDAYGHGSRRCLASEAGGMMFRNHGSQYECPGPVGLDQHGEAPCLCSTTISGEWPHCCRLGRWAVDSCAAVCILSNSKVLWNLQELRRREWATSSLWVILV